MIFIVNLVKIAYYYFIYFIFIHMNTKTLQQKHPKEYQDFFSHSMAVFSLPFSMTWMWSSVEDSIIHIKQALPIRIFIGLRKVKKPWIHFGYFSSYSYISDKFISRIMPDYLPTTDSYIRQILKALPTNDGVEISILWECGRTVGFSMHMQVLFAIFLARKWLDDKAVLSQLSEECLKSPKVVIGPETFIGRFLNEHQTILKASKQDTWCMWLITSLLGGLYPIISFTSENDKQPTTMLAFSLKDFLWESAPEYPYSSYDQAIYYPAIPYLYENYMKSSRPDEINIGQIQEMFRVGVRQSNLKINKQFPDFLKPASNFSYENFSNTLNKIRTYLSMGIMQELIEAHVHESSNKKTSRLIELLEQTTSVDALMTTFDKRMKQCYHDIWEKFDTKTEVPAVFPNITLWSWGSFNIISPTIVNQGAISDLPDTLRSTYPEWVIIYRSWKDGLEPCWFILEQDISQKHYHKLADKNVGLCEIGDELEIVPETDLWNFSAHKIIFDLGRYKIYANGKVVTSKIIPSQSATIEILKLLLESSDNTLKNTELPRSVYTSIKSEMNWKIIWPINKLSREVLGQDFPITIEWSLNKFTVKFIADWNEGIWFFRR